MITIQQLHEISMKYLDVQSIALVYILKELENMLTITDELLIYPKYLYKPNHDVEVYVFTPKHQLIILSYLNEMTIVKTLYLKQIITIESNITDDYRELTLHFMEGEALRFAPNEDTILAYQKEFNKQLRIITRYLHDSTLL